MSSILFNIYDLGPPSSAPPLIFYFFKNISTKIWGSLFILKKLRMAWWYLPIAAAASRMELYWVTVLDSKSVTSIFTLFDWESLFLRLDSSEWLLPKRDPAVLSILYVPPGTSEDWVPRGSGRSPALGGLVLTDLYNTVLVLEHQLVHNTQESPDSN